MAETDQPTQEEVPQPGASNNIWRHITEEKLAQYKKLQSEPDAAAALLAEVLSLNEYRFDARGAIKLDYATGVLEFGYDMGCVPTRISSLLNVAMAVLRICEDGGNFEDCQQCLTASLLGLCCSRPKSDDPKFSPDQVDKIGHFFARTFFRHFKLYSYVFSHEQDHKESAEQLLVEEALLQSLDAALPEEEWHAHLEQQRQQAEDAVRAAQEAEEARIRAEQEAEEAAQEAEKERLRNEELAKKPATLDEAIKHMVAVKVEEEKVMLAATYRHKEEELLAKITDLEKVVVGGK